MTLFVREGLTGVTMVALAAEAGVSRRLVYEHFSNLEDLYSAFFADRAAAYQDAIDRAFIEGEGNVLDAATGVFRRLLEIPADDQRAIRVLAAGAGPKELQTLSDQFRARMVERWLPLLDHPGFDRDVAGALVWALANAILALGELVAREEITSEAATALIWAIVTGSGNAARVAFP